MTLLHLIAPKAHLSISNHTVLLHQGSTVCMRSQMAEEEQCVINFLVQQAALGFPLTHHSVTEIGTDILHAQHE